MRMMHLVWRSLLTSLSNAYVGRLLFSLTVLNPLAS